MDWNPLRNVTLNMQAAGPSTVICVLFICVTALGIWGTGEIAKSALNLLTYAAGATLATLAFRA